MRLTLLNIVVACQYANPATGSGGHYNLSLITPEHHRAGRLMAITGYHWPTFDPNRLTPRQREIAALHDAGLKPAEIAARLGLRWKSVTRHLDDIREKRGE